MILGYFLNAFATFGYLFVDSTAKLFIVQGVLGVANAMATPTWCALFSKYADKSKLGEQWGWSEGGPDIMTGIAILIGGIIVTYFSFEVLFIFMGTVQFITAIIQCFIFKIESK